MPGPLFVLTFLAGCLVLAKAGTWTVNSLVRIADFLKWKKFIVASLLMGFIGSTPELFVGITASIAHKPQLSFGNIIGSNIVLLTLVTGVAVLLGGRVKLKGKVLQRSFLFAMFYALLPLLLMLDGDASRGDGVILIVALVFYLRELWASQGRFSKIFLDKESQASRTKRLEGFFKDLGLFLLGFGLLVLSAEAIVYSASRLALQLNLPLVLVGIIGVALGTSLPELSFGIRSAIMKQKEMVLGNVFGSIAINSALILGITCLISPFTLYNPGLYFSAFIFTGSIVLFFILFSKTGDELTKKEAKVLLFLYVLFFVIQVLLK